MQSLLINRFQSTRSRNNVTSPMRQKPISPISAASCATSGKHSRNQSSKHSQQIIISNSCLCDQEDQAASAHILAIPKLPNLLNTKAKPITHIMSHQDELTKEHKKLKKQLHQEKVVNDQLTADLESLTLERNQLSKMVEKLNLRREQDLRTRERETKELKQQYQSTINTLQEQLGNLQTEIQTTKANLSKQLDKKSRELNDSNKTISINLAQSHEFEQTKAKLIVAEEQLQRIMAAYMLTLTAVQHSHMVIECGDQEIKHLQAEVAKHVSKHSSARKANKENCQPSQHDDRKKEEYEHTIAILRKEVQPKRHLSQIFKLQQICQTQERHLQDQSVENTHLKRSLLTCNADWFLDEQCKVLRNQVDELKAQDDGGLGAAQYRQLFLNAKHELLCLYRMMRDNRSLGVRVQSRNQQEDKCSTIDSSAS